MRRKNRTRHGVLKPMKKTAKHQILNIGEFFEVPSDIALGIPHLELTGNQKVTIDRVEGVLEYDDDTVSINTASFIVKIDGTNLSLSNMVPGSVVISGNILSIAFIL